MPKHINLTGTTGKTYNLEAISKKDTRLNANEELLVQVWYWSPSLPAENPHSKSNPPNLKIGQMWISKKITAESNPEEFLKISEG